MSPTVLSRLVASGTAFVLGFAIAAVGTLLVVGRDRWLWFAVAIVLMLTGVVGVLIADSRRRVSVWAVIGVELLAIFTFLPLLWTFTLATTETTVTPDAVLPTDVRWGVFRDVLGDDTLRRAAITSVLVALVATAVSLLLAVPAAYALVRRRVPGRRIVYLAVVGVLLAPLVALAGPFGDQLRAFGVLDVRLALVAPTLLITLPLALWLSVTLMREVPWSLRDAVIADGASRVQTFRAFGLPVLVPALLTIALITFIAACNDAVIGATLGIGDETRTLPATLLLAAGDPDLPSTLVAATGLLWLLPAVLVLLVLPRQALRLLGRTY